MSWNWAALTPHPPIIVPEIGRGREKEATSTLLGMDRLVGKLRQTDKPDCLLILSPHQPYTPGSLFINNARHLTGSFALFGARSPAFDIETLPEEVDSLTTHLKSAGIPIRTGEADDLKEDQGSLVPLYFLSKAWYDLPPVVFASPIGLQPWAALKLGQALADFQTSRRWGLLASGDLSHRLKPGAPAGYSPAGAEFDQAVIKALETGNPDILTSMPPSTVENAGECGLRSVLTLLGFCRELGGGIDVLSYEGPFGVGYCAALWQGTVTK